MDYNSNLYYHHPHYYSNIYKKKYINKKYMFWIDIETTGLDDNNNHILEIAIFITDPQIEIIYENILLYIKHDEDIYENMTEWAKENLEGVVENSKRIGLTLSEINNVLLNLFQKYVCNKSNNTTITNNRKIVFCGSTVSTDRRILLKHFPDLEKYVSHRTIDVSTLMEMVKLLRPDLIKYQPRNTGKHTAISDIISSMNLYKFYLRYFINNFKQNKFY